MLFIKMSGNALTLALVFMNQFSNNGHLSNLSLATSSIHLNIGPCFTQCIHVHDVEVYTNLLALRRVLHYKHLPNLPGQVKVFGQASQHG